MVTLVCSYAHINSLNGESGVGKRLWHPLQIQATVSIWHALMSADGHCHLVSLLWGQQHSVTRHPDKWLNKKTDQLFTKLAGKAYSSRMCSQLHPSFEICTSFAVRHRLLAVTFTRFIGCWKSPLEIIRSWQCFKRHCHLVQKWIRVILWRNNGSRVNNQSSMILWGEEKYCSHVLLINWVYVVYVSRLGVEFIKGYGVQLWCKKTRFVLWLWLYGLFTITKLIEMWNWIKCWLRF